MPCCCARRIVWGPCASSSTASAGTGFTTERLGGGRPERTNRLRYRPNEWLSQREPPAHARQPSGNKAFTTELDMPCFGLSISPFYPILSDGFRET